MAGGGAGPAGPHPQPTAPQPLPHPPPPAEGKPCLLAEEDKAAVREAMLEGIARSPHAVRVQLGECVRSLVYCDYPEHWPQLLGQVQAYLASQVGAA